jgi:hypothetical protein
MAGSFLKQSDFTGQPIVAFADPPDMVERICKCKAAKTGEA